KAIFFLEGFRREELPVAVRGRLESHLEACPACSARADRIAPLGALFESLSGAPPAGFDAAIDSVRQQTLRTLRAEAASRTRPVSWLGLRYWPIGVPLAVAATLLIGFVISGQRKETGLETVPGSDSNVASIGSVGSAAIPQTPGAAENPPEARTENPGQPTAG